MANQYKVTKIQRLGDFLLENIAGVTKTSVKSMLQNGYIYVDDKVSAKYTLELSEGQVVSTDKSQKIRRETLNCKELTVEYEDESIIVITKKAGLLTISTDSGKKEKTCHSILNEYVQRNDSKARVYVVHRLDKGTSGLLVFAKNEKTKKIMQEHWEEMAIERGYVALVYGKMEKEADSIVTWLKENSALITYSSNVDNGGQRSVTDYRLISEGQSVFNPKVFLSLLDLRLQTGRKNQIRVQLQSLGHPIVGDKKYSVEDTKLVPELEAKRLFLHAYKLVFKHPISARIMEFSSDKKIHLWKKELR